jgi:hypothetical protein
MTDQLFDHFINEHPEFRPRLWKLAGVIRGVPSKENYGWGSREPITYFVPEKRPPRSSGNWKGYIATFRLAAAGSLWLAFVDYDNDNSRVQVNEQVHGEFFIVLQPSFDGPRLYVRFVNGTLQTDPATWMHAAHTGESPSAFVFRHGVHPAFPGRPLLWTQIVDHDTDPDP